SQIGNRKSQPLTTSIPPARSTPHSPPKSQTPATRPSAHQPAPSLLSPRCTTSRKQKTKLSPAPPPPPTPPQTAKATRKTPPEPQTRTERVQGRAYCCKTINVTHPTHHLPHFPPRNTRDAIRSTQPQSQIGNRQSQILSPSPPPPLSP